MDFIFLQKSVVKVLNVTTFIWFFLNLRSLKRDFFTKYSLSSAENKYSLLLPSEIAIIRLSKIFNAFLIKSICPKVIGSNVPG